MIFTEKAFLMMITARIAFGRRNGHGVEISIWGIAGNNYCFTWHISLLEKAVMIIIAMDMLISGCKRPYCILILLFELGVRQNMTLQIR